MSKVIRAAFIITFFVALATFMYAQHNHGASSSAKAGCSCCADTKDGKMAACCDAEKCKMDAKGNCTTSDCCKKTGADACKKACAKSGTGETAAKEGMSCGRKGGCCGGGDKAATAGGAQ